jgi:hypothetical protein
MAGVKQPAGVGPATPKPAGDTPHELDISGKQEFRQQRRNVSETINEGTTVDERPAGQGPASRRAGLRALPTPTDVEIYVDDAPPLLEIIDELPEPRIADLDALLREVDTLRSTMRRDLSLAATAAEAGESDLAGWLLLGEGGEVRAFEERALAHLGALEKLSQPTTVLPEEVLPAKRRVPRMLPAAPLVAAAAAVIGFLTGAVPTGGLGVSTPKTTNTAMQSYAQLTQLASDGASPSRISAAAKEFHEALAPLVASAGNNPAAAEKAIALLQSERAVIAGEADSPALRAVLAQADALVRKLQATLPRKTVRPPVVIAPAPPADEPKRQTSSAKPSASAKPSPSASAGEKPSPSASPKASPSQSSARPSSSPSEQGPIPDAPHNLPH